MFETNHKHSENWYKKVIGNTWGFKKGHTYSHWAGKKMSNETRLKMSKANKGHPGCENSEESLAQIREARKLQVGSKCPAWKGGITPVNVRERNSKEYKEWQKAVFERDAYKCQHCGKVGGYMHSAHVKPFNEYPELRFELTNGKTLCVPCHFLETFNRQMPQSSKWGHLELITA